jgi:hypothetical protein
MGLMGRGTYEEIIKLGHWRKWDFDDTCHSSVIMVFYKLEKKMILKTERV